MRIIFHILLVSIILSLFIQACNTQQGVGDTVYRTNYDIDLDSIPAAIMLDSARVDVYVDGEKVETYFWNRQELEMGVVHFTVTTKDDQVVQVQYAIYSQGLAVASGTDEYNPEDPSQSTAQGTLVRNTEVIDEILGESSSVDDGASSSSAQASSSVARSSSKALFSSSQNKSSSILLSSSVQSSSAMSISSSVKVYKDTDFTVAFSLASNSVKEGQSISVTMILGGPVGAALPEAKTVQLQITGASGSDYSMLSSTTLAKGMLVGQSKSLSFITTGSDNLVEGNEIVSISIGDAGGLNIGTPSQEAVTILDADTAKIEFTTTTSSVQENSGTKTIPVRLVTVPATATLALPVAVDAYLDDMDGNITYTTVTQTGSFSVGQGNGALLDMTYNIGNNGVTNEFASRYIAIGLSVNSGPATYGPNTYYTLFVSEYDFEYYIATDGSQTGGYLYILRPNGTAIEFVKIVSFAGNPFMEITGLPNGNLIAVRGGTAWLLDIAVATPTIAQWSSRTDIADIDYSPGEGTVWVVSNVGKLYAYNTAGTSSTSAYPTSGSFGIAEGIQVGTYPVIQGGVVFTTTTSYDMDCSSITGTARVISTTTNLLPTPNSDLYFSNNYIYGFPKGVAAMDGSNVYVATDGGCEAACTGLFKTAYGNVAATKKGTALNLKEVADMTVTSSGNFIILAGGATCGLEYARVIEYKPGTDALVRQYNPDADGDFQVWKWGGVAVIKNHVDWMQ